MTRFLHIHNLAFNLNLDFLLLSICGGFVVVVVFVVVGGEGEVISKVSDPRCATILFKGRIFTLTLSFDKTGHMERTLVTGVGRII